jgi:hypothetical protein
MKHKTIEGKVTTTARDTTQIMFTKYNTFKESIRQVFRNIE